jgi:YidC/Oxa1 family membrane protein insertase
VLTSVIHAALQALFHLTGNYGWTILLLTLGLRLALLPFAFWQQRSSRLSVQLQSEVKEIQAKYQAEEAQQKLQEVYRRSGGAMLAGCLPALLQWPVFVAMYSGLNTFAYAVPAGFFWLTNLGAPDPYFILPLLAVATSVWQVWATTPKAQRLTMLVLPLVFSLVMLKASAAVALYWVASNVISMAQYYFFARKQAAAAA